MNLHAAKQPAGFTVRTDVEPEYTVLALGGVIDMASAPQVAEHVGAVLRERPALLIFDLSAVTFLATAGMSILMEAHRRCGELSLDCRVVAHGPVTLRPMQLLGIDHMLQLYDSVDLAISGESSSATR
ncbi:STAS domain-containing protein [Mycolicibacterium bacteremicum]|uniref:STAS domain-containing protein n=1 Tax=Mycolicibacterium bacteremicum TaxID=564198 RepID=UPI0026EB63EF|nr:STAS domain-containing protein [Mycolicibacterium bacteremicum]